MVWASPKLGGHMYAGGSTGLAVLRRDGFASMDAGDVQGILTTRPLVFQGRRLFVNADARGGELDVEVLGPDGKSIAPFTSANCITLRADKTCQQVVWKSCV
jgi:hypothetical protein